MTEAEAPEVAFARLRHNRGFQLLWFGEAISVLGSMTTIVVLPLIAVIAFDASALWMGFLTAATWLPWLVLGLPAGAWIDESDHRRVMIAADLFAAVAFLTIPLAWVLDLLTLPHLVCVALAGGVKEVFFRTSYPGLISRLVADDDLEDANGRLYGTEAAMQIAGPGIGGLMVQVMSAAYALVLDVVSFVVSAICLWRIEPESLRPLPPRPPREPLGRRIAEGMRVTVHDRYLAWFMVQGGLSNFALTGYGALLVLFMVSELGVSSGQVGLLMAAGSAGGLIGASVANRCARRFGNARAMLGLMLLGGPPALLIGLARPGPLVWLIPLGALLVGIGVVGANVIRAAFRQRYVPTHLMARTIGASAVVNFGTMPVAALLAGVMGETVGLRPTILVMAAIHAATCLASLWSPWAHRRDLPSGGLVVAPASPDGYPQVLAPPTEGSP